MKCIALLACEKIIIDKDGAHSIINVMLNAEILLQSLDGSDRTQVITIPPDAVAPQVWWIYTIWQPSPDDVGKSFEQVYQTYWPNNDKFMEARITVVLKDDTPMQTSFHVGGLPVGKEGKLKVLTWLDHEGHSVTEVSEALINVKHRTTVPSGAPVLAARF
ncbi:MAG: hypothetical protein WAL52_00915 [Candidatus Sulfotelmatobacter sp.]